MSYFEPPDMFGSSAAIAIDRAYISESDETPRLVRAPGRLTEAPYCGRCAASGHLPGLWLRC